MKKLGRPLLTNAFECINNLLGAAAAKLQINSFVMLLVIAVMKFFFSFSQGQVELDYLAHAQTVPG